MTRASCIPHSKSQHLVIIREDYLAICNGNHCAAAILNEFEQWTNTKLDHAGQHDIENEIAAREGAASDLDTSTWVYMSQEQLHRDLMGMFGERKIADALKELKELGFLTVRTNPKFKWDRTLQYLLNVDFVIEAVQNCKLASRKNATSTPPKRDFKNTKNAEAIPQNTTQNTTERGKDAPAELQLHSVPIDSAPLTLPRSYLQLERNNPVTYDSEKGAISAKPLANGKSLFDAYSDLFPTPAIPSNFDSQAADRAHAAGYGPEDITRVAKLMKQESETNRYPRFEQVVSNLQQYGTKPVTSPAAPQPMYVPDRDVTILWNSARNTYDEFPGDQSESLIAQTKGEQEHG